MKLNYTFFSDRGVPQICVCGFIGLYLLPSLAVLLAIIIQEKLGFTGISPWIQCAAKRV
jgi:hypothetical protein